MLKYYSSMLKQRLNLSDPWEDDLPTIPDIAPAPNFKVGEIIRERYEVLGLMKGAMGDVYHCRDVRSKNDLALKTIISTKKGNKDQLEIFNFEINRMLHLPAHPNVLTFYRIEEINGYYYLLTEWVSGKSEIGNTLTAWLEKYNFTCEKVVNFTQQLICGLIHCNNNLSLLDRPFVFGDIKPDNILINLHGILKLGDFSGGYTSTWVAPEFFPDSPLTPDERSDIFGLAKAAQEMLDRCKEFNTPLWNKLDNVFERCLDYDMDSRFQSLSELKIVFDDICDEFNLKPYNEKSFPAEPFLDKYNRAISAINMGYPTAIYNPLKDNKRFNLAFYTKSVKNISLPEYMESENPVEKKLYHAKNYYLLGEYNKALNELTGTLSNPSLLHLRATVLYAQGNSICAVHDCLSALLKTDHLQSFDLIAQIFVDHPEIYQQFAPEAAILMERMDGIAKNKLTGFLPFQALAKFNMLPCGDVRWASAYFRRGLQFPNPSGDWLNLYLYARCEQMLGHNEKCHLILNQSICAIKADVKYLSSLYKSSVLYYSLCAVGRYDEAALLSQNIKEKYGVNFVAQSTPAN
ncbi:MAG: protein kinase [Ruminococcus flavefaciens]|nr:protein kinase [Ruminococcus flavefaciens]